MRTARLTRFLLSLLSILACALPCLAQSPRAHPRPARPSVQQEEITNFHSDITLQQDSSLQVTETISVIVAGRQIRHGIYRDFPTNYSDPLDNRDVVGFRMLSATLDSTSESFRVEDYGNGKRIYLGDANLFVANGSHVYTITYTTDRQLGFFKDHDELFWNVTGLGWGFPIREASASVHLPASIPVGQVQLSGYTGPQGSRQAQLTTSSQDSVFQFVTTRSLAPREGLTILLTWPKGYIAEPTFSQKVRFFLRDNRGVLLLFGGFLIVLVYYVFAWSAVGRDPEKGVVMALYEPPSNLSPAAMRYLQRMGFDNKTFSAAILDMAVRGFLTIKEQAGSYTLYTTGKPDSVLTEDERAIAASLFNGRNQIWLHNENHKPIRDSLKGLKNYLASTEQKTYFVTNSRYLIAPIAVSLLIAVWYLAVLGSQKIVFFGFLAFWLSIWSLAVYGLVMNAVKKWKAAFQASSSVLAEAAGVGKAILATAQAIPFSLAELVAFWFLWKATSFPFVVYVFACGTLHVLFFHLMKAPTFTGRRLMDQVEGFKMFLGAVDGDRLNRAMPPQQTPAVFERFLPYALALDVEQNWAEKFSGLLAGASTVPGASNGHYAPSFYSGASWNGFSGASFASSFSGSFTSAISSSATAPGSAGGGGGGSGGGGGGGGGGGW
jgi:uncharacterized membrane protein YgcG